jgi:hypothetical protein
MPDLYTEEELDYFASFVDPRLPLGYPVEGEEAEFYLNPEAPEEEEPEEEV